MDKNRKSNINKKNSDNFILHPFALGSLIILLILFVTAAIISYFSFNATVDAIILLQENQNEDFLEEIGDVDFNQNDEYLCNPIKLNISCSSFSGDTLCEYIVDGNSSTQWLSSFVCLDGRRPCNIAEEIKISSQDSFRKLVISNRIEENFYINDLILRYGNKSSFHHLGLNYSKSPWSIVLEENVNEVRIEIIEIMGIGVRYQTGVSNILAYSERCMD